MLNPSVTETEAPAPKPMGEWLSRKSLKVLDTYRERNPMMSQYILEIEDTELLASVSAGILTYLKLHTYQQFAATHLRKTKRSTRMDMSAPLEVVKASGEKSISDLSRLDAWLEDKLATTLKMLDERGLKADDIPQNYKTYEVLATGDIANDLIDTLSMADDLLVYLAYASAKDPSFEPDARKQRKKVLVHINRFWGASVGGFVRLSGQVRDVVAEARSRQSQRDHSKSARERGLPPMPS